MAYRNISMLNWVSVGQTFDDYKNDLTTYIRLMSPVSSLGKNYVCLLSLFDCMFVCWLTLFFRYSDPEDRFSNRFIPDVSDLLRETTLTISDSIETVKPPVNLAQLTFFYSHLICGLQMLTQYGNKRKQIDLSSKNR